MCGMNEALRKPCVQLCPRFLYLQHRYSSMLLKQTMFVPLEEISRRRKRMYGFLLCSTQTCKECPSPASPEEIYRVPPVHRHANDLITSKSNARWEVEVGIMQSIFSRSLLQVHRTSRCQVANATNAPPTHHPSLKKQTTEKDISDQLFVQVHPSCLPSFQPSL